MNWGREKLWCHGGEGALFKEGSQGEWETEQCVGFVEDAMVRGFLGSHWERMFPSWSTFGRRYIASPRTKDLPSATEQPLNSMGQGGRRGWITWSQLFTVLHLRLNAPGQVCHCSSGTEQC